MIINDLYWTIYITKSIRGVITKTLEIVYIKEETQHLISPLYPDVSYKIYAEKQDYKTSINIQQQK